MSQLGPYRLIDVLGRGGLGEVWSAMHVNTGAPVAVKIVDRALPNSDPLRDEVEAAASLHHPHIVRVFDFDHAPDDEVMPQGRPFLVMERLGGGSLQALLGRLPWPQIARLTDELLSALAFSHARGIIHRDVKPANVLLTDEGTTRLADFGLAFALHAGGARSAGGTPRYMAPEQQDRSWRDHGPWTDLYAVGWLVTALVHGQPSELAPRRVAVPEGYTAWVERLRDPDPAARFRRAADARYALSQLGPPTVAPAPVGAAAPTPPDAGASILAFPIDTAPGADSEPSHPERLDRPTDSPRAEPTLALPSYEISTTGDALDAPRPLPSRVTRLSPPAPPPLPRTWQPERPRPLPRPLLGVGLGLVGLRVLPVVGRGTERTALWRALHQTLDLRRPVLRVLHGSSGVGKSRLASWVGERAHELGAATVLTARHSPEPGPGHGLAAMLARALRVEGLGHDMMTHRIRRELAALGEADSALPASLTTWIRLGVEAPDPTRKAFSSDEERWSLLVRTLDLLARRRAVVLWLDDVQWGADALRFADYLMARRVHRPVLILATVRDDLLPDEPVAEDALDAVLTRADDRHARIPVGPLSAPEHRALLNGLLGLDDRSLSDIERRTQGNPLFAVELVEHWAQRGALVPAASGYAIDATRAGALPHDLLRLWDERIERALRGHPEAARRAVALAAVLGPTIEPATWERACRAAGLRAQRSIIQTLREQRLITADRSGWHLVHGMLREALLAQAAAAGELEALHLAAAHAIPADGSPGRHGLHLLRGGRPAEALPSLLRAARDAVDIGDVLRAERLLDQALEALNALERPRIPGGAIIALLQARGSLRRGAYPDAIAAAERAYALAEADQHAELSISAAALAARAWRLSGDAEVAQSWLDRGHARRRRVDNPWFRVIIDVAQGVHSSRCGDLGRSASALVEARSQAGQAVADRWVEPPWYRVTVASIDENLASVARLRGDLDAMVLHLERAREAHERSGEFLGDASCAILLGEVHRLRGESAEAIAVLRAVWRRLESLGSPQSVIPWINLVIIHLVDGRDAGLWRLLEDLVPELERLGNTGLCCLARLCRCAQYIHDDAWDAFDVELDTALDELNASGLIDPDVALVAECLAARAERADELLRASQLRRIAVAQRAALER